MKGFKKLIPLILMILTMILVPLGTRADFGDYSGDSDYGDSDWGDSDWGDSGWDDDSDYDSDYSGSSGGGIEGVIITCVVIFIVAIINKKTSKSTKNTTTNNTSENHSDLRNVSEYNSIDPNFSAADMTEKISNLYVRFQNCWTAKDIDPLRPYLTDAMFAQMDRQLDGYRQRKETNRVERISVLGVRLLGWKQENGKDVMIARLDTRIVDYVVDDRTGAILRGSSKTEKFMTYEWSLVRTTGVVTGTIKGTSGQTCPYCGAHVDINHSAVCEYCNSVLTTDSFDWAVSNIKGIAQRSK